MVRRPASALSRAVSWHGRGTRANTAAPPGVPSHTEALRCATPRDQTGKYWGSAWPSSSPAGHCRSHARELFRPSVTRGSVMSRMSAPSARMARTRGRAEVTFTAMHSSNLVVRGRGGLVGGQRLRSSCSGASAPTGGAGISGTAGAAGSTGCLRRSRRREAPGPLALVGVREGLGLFAVLYGAAALMMGRTRPQTPRLTGD